MSRNVTQWLLGVSMQGRECAFPAHIALWGTRCQGNKQT